MGHHVKRYSGLTAVDCVAWRRPAVCLLALLVNLCVWDGARAQATSPGADAAEKQDSVPATTELVVKATTDISEAEELIAEFMKLNPAVHVRYSKVLSTEVFDSVVKGAASKGIPDVAWSSSMDLQIKLANDGYASVYRSTEADQILTWARWKDRAYGITAEPVVMVYNKRLLRDDMIPRDHADLTRLLTDHTATFHGKIATYDPEASGSGLLFITQDVLVTPQTWKLVSALGRAGVKLYASSRPMIDRVGAGELLLAYNVLGSYALERAKQNPDIGIVFPSDYTLLLSRIALIPASAREPALAHRFIDFLLSRTGQKLLAENSLGSVREDMKTEIPGYAVAQNALRPIALSIDLLTYLDQAKRRRFLKDWKDALRER
jgi:iron(III) transport system substrate-binding protein